MADDFDLYEFPKDHVGRKTYVSVRGHSKSIPVIYTYKGYDGRNYLHPEYGGDWSGYVTGQQAATVMRDIGEYTSVVDGSHITSRSQHREHMRRHELIEVGNERMPSRQEAPMPSMGRDIKRAIEQLRARA